MDEIDLSRGQSSVLNDAECLRYLPDEILELIRTATHSTILDTLSRAALIPQLTLELFARFEEVFADTASRWIERDLGKNGNQNVDIIAAFARVLPFAPSLSVYLERYLSHGASSDDNAGTRSILWLHSKGILDLLGLPPSEIQRLLLAAYRLLIFEKNAFAPMLSESVIQPLLEHTDRTVRYLAIRILCVLLSTSDAKLETMIEHYVGREDAVMGDYDGLQIDYSFLSLYEERRAKKLQDLRKSVQEVEILSLNPLCPQQFSHLVTPYLKTLLPRPNGQPHTHCTLVSTNKTCQNQEAFAKALLSPAPILIHGLSGSGKTALVNDFARELGMDSTMVTLHLNEQTDAKMLIGMYATDSTPGSFKWRPGVLTTAVREGRWVLIEDLDRAPNEVISVILPLIERSELMIPNRGEAIKAARGFKLIASIRTSLNMNGNEAAPSLHMLGARLWHRVPIHMPSQDEFQEIINGIHPILHKFVTGIIGVYNRLYTLFQRPSFTTQTRISLGRPINPRDLLKWCRRLDGILISAGSRTGEEPIQDSTKDEMFMEAADCFAASLQTSEARSAVVHAIAEEMHISPERAEHFLAAHVPRYEDSDLRINIGRVSLRKRKTSARNSKPTKRSRPFANTSHAKRLLEQVGVAVKMAEPVLLVGETGIGKTTVVQQLADSLGFKLTAVNLSQQSEVGDLLGGFKPVNVRSLAIPLKDEFDELFAATGISTSKNQRYLEQLGKYVAKGYWSKASKLWHEAPKMFEKIVAEIARIDIEKKRQAGEQPAKKRKTESKSEALLRLKPRWDRFSDSLKQFDLQLAGGSKGFAFTFVEGNIIKAVRNGDWVLLDEINLAAPDTLESIADLLHSGPGSQPSILLSETGEIERIKAHPDFRIFGAMNPATDVGKRDLPLGLRSRFTEIYVESPDRDLDDLLSVIKAYLRGASSNDERAAHDVARLYINTKRLADEKRLVDGANQVPHFSLRTLTRTLSYVNEIASSYGLRRALYEGFSMSFLTLLNRASESMLMPLIDHHLLDTHKNSRALLSQTPRHPEDGKQYVRFVNKDKDRQYWMLQGREPPQEQPHYIITNSVERNMLNLVRATSTRRFPVLVQGPTSSGKTSMIEYLAKYSGNKFVRINNHEHTDLQEYLGTYVSGPDGQLRFQEGLLVQALREGHWIVLDELNLAPTDVLEALNRLLDDNRELLIPETQETVRPHENFMLFATQNPPGLYGGRKTLSRAFRNRFLELHFDDIPEHELHTILTQRSQKVAPSDCERIVKVYKELSTLRQSSRLFEQKDSFATLRDLFRWALRDADNRAELAANGYMLLAERVRKPEERLTVKEVIERVMKEKIDPHVLYDANLSTEVRLHNATTNSQGVVWTRAMRRLYVLVSHALRNNEPVLLVGETGCGKTTVCQMLAEAFGKELHILNAHQNTETGDLIGAQRPLRNRAAVIQQLSEDLHTAISDHVGQIIPEDHSLDILLAIYYDLSNQDLAKIPNNLRAGIRSNGQKAKALFEWSDGGLVQAMKEGQFYLLDEISLADDSVLERLNSVLEPSRALLLAEKGVEGSFVQAAQGFQFFATMNPGGDYGKRELSPALRNRFTEIWVPSLSEIEDILLIVETKLNDEFKQFASRMVQFSEWFGQTYRSANASISVRDMLAWIAFVNGCGLDKIYDAILHGAAMVYVDTLGANPAALLAVNPESLQHERSKCLRKLGDLFGYGKVAVLESQPDMSNSQGFLTIGSFSLVKDINSTVDLGFAFEAPTTKLNAMRVIRALQVEKPILIEGSPGVGKTTLVTALAQASGKPLTRINLSEQTDLMDLFGSDVPVEGADAGHFAWRDAPFLQAMQRGDWVLLDEMNLASQSVLEGLNACLDHRGEVYISELDQTFKRHPNFAVFAAQNPHHQGGGRKGLPSSFVNRFTVVYADIFKSEDLTLICKRNFPTISEDVMSRAIQFVSSLEDEVIHKGRFGGQGRPWEFNLRDILRWLKLLTSSDPFITGGRPSNFLNLIFRLRFRTLRDRQEANEIFKSTFGHEVPFRHFSHKMSSEAAQVGLAYLLRDELSQQIPFPTVNLNNRLPELESLMICVQQNWPCILVGPSGSGKTTLLQHVAATAGVMDLVIFPLNSDTDTMDLVGGFEQIDPRREAVAYLTELRHFIEARIRLAMPHPAPLEALQLLEFLRYGEIESSAFFANLHSHLVALQSTTTLDGIDDIIQQCAVLRDRPIKIKSARFEWVDGILIKALEQGRWLVLDNANLCSSSVLDRLNSLLEPNGFLSINEHCGPNGEPKIVKPHPSFRLFLTVDPRFGELSRAMRNRAIEIFLEPFLETNLSNFKAVYVNVDTSLQQYKVLRDAVEISDPQAQIVQVAFDNLAWNDLPLLNRFADSLQNGLLASPLGDCRSHIERLFQRYYHLSQSREDDDFRTSSLSLYSALEQRIQLCANFGKTQTIHPLQNSPLVPLIQESSHSDQSFWLGALLDLGMEVKTALATLEAQNTRTAELKPSKMNRLQRSIASGRMPDLTKDSTVGVASFLMYILGKVLAYVKENVNVPNHWRADQQAISRILAYWMETYTLVSASKFEEATFQAHLTIGRALLSNLPSDVFSTKTQKLATYFNNQIATRFNSGFRLTTGLSMEILWKRFRPMPIRNVETQGTLRQMEQLAVRFDALRWKTSVPIKELGSITNSLAKAYRAVLVQDVDGNSLVEALNSELAILEARAEDCGSAITPFFAGQFESLRQFSALHRSSSDLDVFVLSDQPTASLMRLSSASATSGSLQHIDFIHGVKNEIRIVSNVFSASLLEKVRVVDDVDLKSLRLLEIELPMLGEKIAAASEVVCGDSRDELNKALLELMVDIIEVNDVSITARITECFGSSARRQIRGLQFDQVSRDIRTVLSEPSSAPTYFQQVVQDHFIPAISAICMATSSDMDLSSYTALALIHIALGFLVLYVPDRSFDPDRRQWLERERHERMRDILQNKMSALQKFENLFTGQESNLRYQLVKTDFDALGEPNQTLQKIYRPEVSELDQLQGEFSNLLSAVVRSLPVGSLIKSLDGFRNGDDQQLKLLQGNVTQIIRRLSNRFHGYSDLTAPVITMLRYLQVGLAMANTTYEEQTTKADTIMQLSKVTPFLGGVPSGDASASISDQPLEFLAITATAASIEGLNNFGFPQRQALFNAFHSCYEQWSQRLESDRKEAESKTGLYHFKGSAEDEEEEDQDQFNELFPAYDDNSPNHSPGAKSSRSSRDTAIELSNVHAEMFFEGKAPSASTISLLRSISSHIGAVFNKQFRFGDNNMDKALLPGALLLLNDQIEALTSESLNSESYNFYSDANLPEARKLVGLVHQIQTRFKDLQQVDEIAHMQPLDDVLVSCRELLEFRHTEPIAKIITKVEKIHTHMHEWQFGGWASRANSALALYDSLTSTIISWRRLELSTWAKLFDMEDKTCQDDAKSWWFVAYQVVVAAPLSMAQSGEDLSIYAQKLLRDLESYFSTAMLGQFVQRLKLLKQLQKHLGLLVLDVPAVAVIYNALSNFVEMYEKYETTVAENLRKGRMVLEKAMKDILLLASWKDTNIVALRDSAKRSHHKLFKVVRKYRALLGTSMDITLKSGLPDINDTPGNVFASRQIQLPLVDMMALTLCEKSVPHWLEKSKRLLNISKTVSIMDSTTQLPETTIDPSQYIDSFLDNLISSIAELQKQTPSILNEENANTVKHLKTRKRKLFADTLKELREMGISYNLGVTSLAKQDSLSIVLANTSHLPAGTFENFEGIMYYYHKTLDLVPRAREATRNHSEDLTTSETARCAGYLEGLLQVVVKQHNILSNAVSESSELEKVIDVARNLWAPDAYQIIKSDTNVDPECLLRRLATMLAVASELVRIHSRVGKIDSKEVQDTLASLEDKIKNLMHRWIHLPALPAKITTTAHAELYNEVEASLQVTREDLVSLSQKQPGIAFIVDQVLPWAELPSQITRNANKRAHTYSNIEDLDQKISLVCNKVFAALEKLQSSIKGLPPSTSDPAWLVKNEACSVDSIKSLHVSEITSQIEGAFKLLHFLDLGDAESGRIAGAVFAVVSPIFKQYSNVVQQCMGRYASLHRSSCKMAYILAKSFTQIASQGFCTPSEKSEDQSGKTEKLEGGTGLGDGEGAEDISKDIQDDEDLTELAQEQNQGEKEEIEDEKDAVDMADGEMEGEMGEAEEKGSDDEGSGDDESGDEMDEEAGDVDDLDPNAVDEKMWDGDDEKADKDQEGDESKGKANKKEQVAAEDNETKAGDDDKGGEEEEEAAGAEQSEEVKQDEAEKHDPHAEEGETLELPEEMELDGDGESEGSCDGEDKEIDELSNFDEADNAADDKPDVSKDEIGEGEDADVREDQEMGSDLDAIDLDEEEDKEDGEGEKTENAASDKEEQDEQPEEEQEGLLQDRTDDANADPDNAIPSDVAGVGEEQDENQTEDNANSSKAQREDGGEGGDSSEEKPAAAADGDKGRQANGEAPQIQDEETQDTADAQPFKKLGDALERWHRQQTDIREAPEGRDQPQEQAMDMDVENQEYQHLQDENAEPDTQALGTATEEQARALDESMAIDSESKDQPEIFQPDGVEQPSLEDEDQKMEDVEDILQDSSNVHEGRAGAMIQQATKDKEEDFEYSRGQGAPVLEEDVEDVDNQLAITHLNDYGPTPFSRSAEDARQLWTQYETSTRDLSLSLTEQLRLILAPTLATKMRGDFRTGKRLNIKRIIPYIASSFKRDKIWMRRSIPSKRSYQIMLAVDDSKSMGASGSGDLAFETLAMISKSLSMLEVGEICIVGFGEDVKVAHEFDTPFSADAGPRIFRNFGFEQSKTDVTKLVRQSISLFRTARAKASSSPADLWQLQLIISDGVCDSSEHETIRRLLREAIEERIMMVFVIVDDLKGKKKGESVLELKEAKFVDDDGGTGGKRLVIERYLDTFPFQYYLVVSDVRELPGVLAQLLRQWFAETADSN